MIILFLLVLGVIAAVVCTNMTLKVVGALIGVVIVLIALIIRRRRK